MLNISVQTVARQVTAILAQHQKHHLHLFVVSVAVHIQTLNILAAPVVSQVMATTTQHQHQYAAYVAVHIQTANILAAPVVRQAMETIIQHQLQK